MPHGGHASSTYITARQCAATTLGSVFVTIEYSISPITLWNTEKFLITHTFSTHTLRAAASALLGSDVP